MYVLKIYENLYLFNINEIMSYDKLRLNILFYFNILQLYMRVILIIQLDRVENIFSLFFVSSLASSKSIKK